VVTIDSWHIWSPLLKRANLKENATLVAVDLPGYGGSDGLANYDADTVLDVLAEFIVHMRESYLSISETGHGPVVVAGHDWGCVIASRLAAEAPVLADRFILSNAFAVSVNHISLESRANPE
jgi:pimeloyl-ACP methyl ester carboxylesterase